MAEPLPDSLGGFVDEVEPSEKELLLVNRTEPAPLVRLLERAFDDQPVRVAEEHRSTDAEDVVCLVEDGTVRATSPLGELSEAFLMVNADRYRTGNRQIERGSFPAVLTGLDGVEFTVRGFPQSNKEKLLLILVSRFIEFRALERDAGEFHSTFQRLSRLDDEYGTRKVYEWLGDSEVDTHVYGVRDAPSVVETLDLNVHAGTTNDYRRSWVVVFSPPESPDEGSDHVALVAVETGTNVWRGTWTYDGDRVERIRSYLVERL